MRRRRTDPYAPADERFAAKVDYDESGCWFWTGSRSPKGYGNFYVDRRIVRAHRWAYERFIGPIPDGFVIDHLCRNTSCVNPQHLEAVTPRTNTMRGVGTSSVNAQKTRCHKGHEFAGDNVRIDHKGGRVCVACKRERANRTKRLRHRARRDAA